MQSTSEIAQSAAQFINLLWFCCLLFTGICFAASITCVAYCEILRWQTKRKGKHERENPETQ